MCDIVWFLRMRHYKVCIATVEEYLEERGRPLMIDFRRIKDIIAG